jgi:hypothetical protein
VHFFFKTINDDTTLQCFFVCTVEMEKIVETDLKEVDIFFSSIYTKSIGHFRLRYFILKWEREREKR